MNELLTNSVLICKIITFTKSMVMLSKKSIYIIFLFHKAYNIFQNSSCKKNVSSDRYRLNEIRLRSYITGSRPLAFDLDNDTISDMLDQLNEIMDTLSISKEVKKEFPRSIYQFNRYLKKWLLEMKSSSNQN